MADKSIMELDWPCGWTVRIELTVSEDSEKPAEDAIQILGDWAEENHADNCRSTECRDD